MSVLFKKKLQQAGLTQEQFRQIVETLSGLPVKAQHVNSWVRSIRANLAAVALAELISRISPRERDKLLRISDAE